MLAVVLGCSTDRFCRTSTCHPGRYFRFWNGPFPTTSNDGEQPIRRSEYTKHIHFLAPNMAERYPGGSDRIAVFHLEVPLRHTRRHYLAFPSRT